MKVSMGSLVVISSVFIILYYISQNKGGNTPPGPLGFPFFGYLPFMSSKPHLVFQNLAKDYGSIFSVRLGSHNVIVIDDIHAIENVLSEKSKVKHTQIGDSKRFWKDNEVSSHTMRELGIFKIQIDNSSMKYIKDKRKVYLNRSKMRRCLKEFVESIASMGNDTRLNIGHSFRLLKNSSNGILKRIRKPKGAKKINFSLWEIIQFLSIGSGIQLAGHFGDLEDFVSTIKKQLEENWNIHHICSNFDAFADLQTKNTFSYNGEVLKYPVRNLIEMNCELHYVTLEWLLLIMATFSEIQQKVVVEIESTIGLDRLPWATDLITMPYIQSVVMELLRWKTFSPLSCLWITNANTLLDGYFIPKGSLLLANIWSVNHNPKYWGEDVYSYKPERFLSQDGKNIKRDPNFIEIFIGRDNFPKQHFMLNEILLHFVMILQKFKISLPEGKSPDLQTELHMGLRPKEQELIMNRRK